MAIDDVSIYRNKGNVFTDYQKILTQASPSNIETDPAVNKYILVGGGRIGLRGLERGEDGQVLLFDSLKEIITMNGSRELTSKSAIRGMMESHLRKYGGVLNRQMYDGTGYGTRDITYEELTHIRNIKGTLYFSKDTQRGVVFTNKYYSVGFYFISNEFTKE